MVCRDHETTLAVLNWALEKVDTITLDAVNDAIALKGKEENLRETTLVKEIETLNRVQVVILDYVEKVTPIDWYQFDLGWESYCLKHHAN